MIALVAATVITVAGGCSGLLRVDPGEYQATLDQIAVLDALVALDSGVFVYTEGDSPQWVTSNFTVPVVAGDDVNVSWSSTDESLVTVDNEGLATVTRPGPVWGTQVVGLVATGTKGSATDSLEIPVTLIRSGTTSETILHASDAEVNDNLGYSVAISGDYAIAGAPHANRADGGPSVDGAGAVYFYHRSETGWEEIDILHASDAEENDNLGSSVAISGDYAVAGAPQEDGPGGDPDADIGAVYVYHRTGTSWEEVDILHAADAQDDDNFGFSVAISGNYLIVGAPYEDGGAGDPAGDSGAAYVFERDEAGWSPIDPLHATGATGGEQLGYDVSISGDTAIAGAPTKDSAAGTAHVFRRNATGWEELDPLVASDTHFADFFGWSVAISGDYLVCGAWNEAGGPGDPLTGSGAAYVFERLATGWEEVDILHASDAQGSDWFGWSVAIDGYHLIVGAYKESGGLGDPVPSAGAAYLFTRDAAGWSEGPILRASDAQPGDQFGWSVAISGEYALVGAYLEDGGDGDPVANSGAVYMLR